MLFGKIHPFMLSLKVIYERVYIVQYCIFSSHQHTRQTNLLSRSKIFSISTKWLDDTGAPGLRSHFENHNLRLMLLRIKYILNDQKYS